tara:strand:+ start:190 stop:489 length:300 start_codon:yes stop_codon:yes gene_type:complete
MGDTEDRIERAIDGVNAVLRETLTGADDKVPIATAAAAVTIGVLGRFLDQMGGEPGSEEPDTDSILLAALVVARMGTSPGGDGIGQAYKDLERLKQVIH